ncbi:MAG: mechanosensitive ion channel [Candidatus Endonucleobacter bathymodioli]|uniref:Mechanosensitive ion channel n=1 Tax=Candidatus Endonucleibacter bathymodioli TaxID=539814 RepID=A0AA90NQ95_9GAMM|nr:mechanosensitive ion channel [Candidatus Endonucleobacter bathymodioli]
MGFIVFIFSPSTMANQALLQEAYRELQQLLKPADTSPSPDFGSEQVIDQTTLDEQNAKIEKKIISLKQRLSEARSHNTVDTSRLKLGEAKRMLIDQKRQLLSWQNNKVLSQEASIKLNRKRLSCLEEISYYKSTGPTSGSSSKQKNCEQLLTSISLKIRFAEQFQLLASQQAASLIVSTLALAKRINMLSGMRDTDNQDESYPDISYAKELKNRLSQARTDLVQLQDLHYEVEYQLDQLDNAALLYQVLERQKKRIYGLSESLTPQAIRQELKLNRYLLFDEKAELKSLPSVETTEQLRKANDSLEQLEELIRQADELQKREGELKNLQQKLKTLLEQRQLWMKSASSLDWDGWLSLVENLLEQIPVFFQHAKKILYEEWWWLLFLIPALIFYRMTDKINKERLSALDKPSDLTLVKSIWIVGMLFFRPIPFLLILFLGLRSILDSDDISHYYVLLLSTFAWLVLLDATKESGFFEKYLKQNTKTLPWSRSLACASIFALWITGFTFHWYGNPLDNRLGQISLLLSSFWQLWLCYLWKTQFSLSDWRGISLRICTILLFCVIFFASWQGYIQVAWLLFSHLQSLILTGGFLFFGYLLACQWVSIRTNQLIIQQAMRMRQNQSKQPTTKQAITTSRSSVKEFENQGRVMLSLFFTALSLVLVGFIWQNVSPILTIVAKTHIFTVSAGQTALTLALGSIIGCFAILFVTWLIGRNLPGLLQILLPTSFQNRPGYSYNIHRISTYFIWATGIVLALSQMGMPWEKLQWAILAISVGAGVGLQDIVANFFSGLIILVERPFRIGDTITVGDIDGTVCRISVRATVIEGFDRKELVIPNRILVSGQITNWSLSSPILRIQLWYSLEHGSDNDLIYQLLQQAADESQKVLKSPPPEIYFVEYTEQAERYEIRLFVNHVDDRFPAKNQVNRKVKVLFAENGIKVSRLKYAINIEKKA